LTLLDWDKVPADPFACDTVQAGRWRFHWRARRWTPYHKDRGDYVGCL